MADLLQRVEHMQRLRQREYWLQGAVPALVRKYKVLLNSKKELPNALTVGNLFKNKLNENLAINEEDTIPGIFKYKVAIKVKRKRQMFYYNIDLRVYGPEPDIPIIFEDQVYSLTKQQERTVRKLWLRVDPDRNNGVKYVQDTEYIKSLASETKI